MTPTLSIITICRNEGKYLRYTVNSVLSQSFKDFELIIVDAFSSDGSLEFLTNLSDSRIKFYKKEPRGIYDAINYGIEKSCGEIINVLNGGDFYATKDSIFLSLESLKDNNYDFIFSRALFFYREFNVVKSIPHRVDIQFPFICHQSLFYRKTLHDRFGIYNIEYKFSADFDFFTKIWGKCHHSTSEESFFSVVRVKDGQQASEIGSRSENETIIKQVYNSKYLYTIDTFQSIIYKLVKDMILDLFSKSVYYNLRFIYWKYFCTHDFFLRFKNEECINRFFPIDLFCEL